MKYGFALYSRLPVAVDPAAVAVTEKAIRRALDHAERNRVLKALNLVAVCYEHHKRGSTWIEVQRALRCLARSPGMLQVNVGALPDGFLGHLLIGSDSAFSHASKVVSDGLQARGIDRRSATNDEIANEARYQLSQENPFARIGRSRDAIPRVTLLILADLFESLGGKASCAFNPLTGERDTPFMRWLKGIAVHFPPDTGALLSKGVDDRARVVLKQRKTMTDRPGIEDVDLSAFSRDTQLRTDEAPQVKWLQEQLVRAAKKLRSPDTKRKKGRTGARP